MESKFIQYRMGRVLGRDLAACDAAIRVIQEGFFPFESVCRGCDLTASPSAVVQVSCLVRAALQDDASVAMYCGDQMVGVSVNKLQVPPVAGKPSFFEWFRDEHSLDPRARFLIDYVLRIEDKVDLFGILGEGKERILDVMYVGVLPSFRGRGIATQLVKESVAVALEKSANAVTSIFSTTLTRAIGRKLGFKELVVAEHSEFIFDGVPINTKLSPEQQRSYLAILEL